MSKRLLYWINKHIINEGTDTSFWKRYPTFTEENKEFEYWIIFILFIQVGLCVFVMLYLTFHREVNDYWYFKHNLEIIQNIFK